MKKRIRKKVRRKGPPFPLRDILKRHGLTQYALARKAGMSDQEVSDLVRGRRKPNWATLMNVLTSIGADLGDLAPKGGAA